MRVNVGDRFGRLVTIKAARITNGDKSRHAFLCKCDCGKKTVVREDSLYSGRTTSCGCFGQEQLFKVRTKHGGRYTRLYCIWQNMKRRCYNPKNTAYEYYGAKGVSVCEDWLNFIGFREWAQAHGYRDDLTIDRIDPAVSYEPSNCQWMPQGANTIRAHLGMKYNMRRIKA